MASFNRGQRIGGPFDGTEYDVLIWPPDYPNFPDGIPEERLTVNRVFNKDFPEGAIYHWDEKEKVWRYVGPFEDSTNARNLLNFFGAEPAPDL
jgi:hypothetical protein